MTSYDLSASHAPRGSLAQAALPIFASALFLSAFLLFAVQPMFTKMVLPILGGSPSVWSVAMVFFQAMLLAGYCYAHLLIRALPIRHAAFVHLGVMAIAFLALPIALSSGAYSPPASGEATWLIGVFLASVGLPFFAVAGNGPLLQAWFARSGHPHARDPYFLYGASNVGSFAALIAYPLMIEPLLTLGAQTRGWTLGFGLLAVAIGVAALSAMRGGSETMQAEEVEAGEAPTLRERAIWIALSAVPSGLLVSVTAHISTDVAAAPLLWVVPLAMFLATFVLVFREKPVMSETLLARLQIWLAAAVMMILALGNTQMSLGLPAHLALFFVNAMVCHTALYQRRPAAGRLTDFYLMMSLGGVIGGVFCGLIAPKVFSSVAEYPLLIAAALFCAPATMQALGADRETMKKEAGTVAVAGLAALALIYVVAVRSGSGDVGRMLSGAGVGAAMLFTWRTPARAAMIGVVAAVTATIFQGLVNPRETYRSFFGVHKVREIGAGQFRIIEHGTTLHGAMRIRNADGAAYTGAPEPTTYYTTAGALAEAIRSVREVKGGRIGSTSLVGLGAGALACQFEKGEKFRFYEIDPEVIRLASDPRYFRFLSECGGRDDVVLGDARLTLARQAQKTELLVVDAFSSDAIPLHLLTREALAAYLRHVTPDGAIVMHISNKYFDLRRILARTAADVGLSVWTRLDISEEPMEQRMRTSSMVVALARNASELGPLASNGRWEKLEPAADVTPWTDDYSNILAAVRDKMAR